jgi:hypothetical protein
MDEMVTRDLESQNSNDGGANGSNLIATTILRPTVRDLAFSASNKAQNRVLKQAAALKRDADTEFRNKFRCMEAEKRARGLESTLVEATKASTPQIVHHNQRHQYKFPSMPLFAHPNEPPSPPYHPQQRKP